MKIFRQSTHTVEEIAGNVFHAEAEKIAELRAGDEDGDAVGEANDDRAREIFDHCAQSGDAHEDEKDSGEHGAGEQASDSVAGNYSEHDDDEGSGGSAD